jgi:glycosyltransferase involved in cell wall biosynthesis
MGKVYVILIISFIILFIINVIFGGLVIHAWIIGGLQSILDGMNFGERIATSNQIKWIILIDFIWIGVASLFLFRRKHYKTDLDKHYLSINRISEPKVCVIIPTYNEEDVVSKVVADYKNQKFVTDVLVVDNHSIDDTVKLARMSGATVIEKPQNLGYGHSCYIGLKESMKNNSNVIVLTECDGTFMANDIQKMIPYLDNCDMVIGTRQVQVLTEKGNQNSMFYVWGNLLIAKLLQLKYFSLLHMGVVNLTDVGCSYRAIRKDSLKKIIEQLESPQSQKTIYEKKGWLFTIFLTMLAISNDLKLVEIPITFKKRIGISKSQANQKKKGLVYGLNFIWFIISN